MPQWQLPARGPCPWHTVIWPERGGRYCHMTVLLFTWLPAWPPGKQSPHVSPTFKRPHPDLTPLTPPNLWPLLPRPLCPSAIPTPSVLPAPPTTLPPHSLSLPAAVQQGQAGHCVLICNPLPFVSSPGPGWRRERKGRRSDERRMPN